MLRYHWTPMREVIEWLDSQNAESLRLIEIAKHFGYSEYHFSRVFREHVCMSPFAYRRKRALVLSTADMFRDVAIGTIAEWHGYQSMSAYSRAFRKAFGYTPTAYRRLVKGITESKGGSMFTTERITSKETLRIAYDLADRVLNLSSRGHMPYTYEFFASELKEGSGLLLCGKIGRSIVAVAFGKANPNNHVTLALVAVDENHRRNGYGTKLVEAFVETVRSAGHPGIALGSNDGADDFYIKCGFTPTLFLQSKKHSLDELRGLNTSYRELWGLERDENGYCRLMLETPTVDVELRSRYQEKFSDCFPQTVFRMNLLGGKEPEFNLQVQRLSILIVHLVGSFEAESFSWSVVEFLCDPVALNLGK